MLAWLQTHWLTAGTIGFTVISIALNATASIFAALGRTAPSWLGTASSWTASALHFLNGNTQAASAAAVQAKLS